MSARIQEAVVEEALKHSALMRTNCALKHGIDKDYGRTNLGEQDKPPAPVQSPQEPSSVVASLLSRLKSLEQQLAEAMSKTPSPGNPLPPATQSLLPWAKLAAAGLLGSGLATGGYFIGQGATNNTTVINDPSVQSVIPFLEEQGLNTP